MGKSSCRGELEPPKGITHTGPEVTWILIKGENI